MTDYAEPSHESPQVVHREQGLLWKTSHAQPGMEVETCPQYPQALLPLQGQTLKSKDLLARSQSLKDEADALVRGWWEQQQPRPIQKFVVIRQVVQRALEAGWPQALILEAMDNVPTISARWLEGYANRHKKGAQPDRLAAVKRMLESEQ